MSTHLLDSVIKRFLTPETIRDRPSQAVRQAAFLRRLRAIATKSTK